MERGLVVEMNAGRADQGDLRIGQGTFQGGELLNLHHTRVGGVMVLSDQLDPLLVTTGKIGWVETLSAIHARSTVGEFSWQSFAG
jgi:hypothetical protein